MWKLNGTYMRCKIKNIFTIFSTISLLILVAGCGGVVGGGTGSGGSSNVGASIVPTIKPVMPEAPTTLFAVGDIAQCASGVDPLTTAAAKTAKLINTLSADAPIITLGDNVYASGTAAEFANCYQPTWGSLLPRTWATPGNHDYGVKDAAGYFDYFGQHAGLDRRGFYAIKIGKWKVISLNSQIDSTTSSEQVAWLRTWLRKELANTPAACTLAVWHYPRYSSSAGHGSMTQMQEVWRVLQDAKADLVLQSHDHTYERFARMDADGNADANGMRSFVVGTGGAALYGFKTPYVNGSEAREGASFGVLKLSLFETRYRWEFIDINGAILDRGEDSCRL